MKCAEIARRLHLDERTVKKWGEREKYEPRKAALKSSILDPYKVAIRRDWELGGCTGTELMGRLCHVGYTGGYTILKTYLHGLRRELQPKASALLLPSEWMLRLLQGKIDLQHILADIRTIPRDDAIKLLAQIRDGPLWARNRALAVLAHRQGIPIRMIARFLMVDHRTVPSYIRDYNHKGLDSIVIYRRSGERKHEQQHYKDAVFVLLHSPPQKHGVNRTSWRMDDLKRVLRDQGVLIDKGSIRRIIRNAGYRFRSAKRVLTSSDPQYQEKLAEITRVLSALTESQKFFSIDEFGPFAVKIQGGRALTAPGQNRTFPQWQKSKGSLTLVGALELSTNQITHFYSNRKSTAEMIELMHLLLHRYCDQSLVVLVMGCCVMACFKRVYTGGRTCQC